MTAQIPEVLFYEGKKHGMCSHPLGDYFAFAEITTNFDTFACTALWRGYVGTWEIINDRLYLTQLTDASGIFDESSQVSVATYFPDYPERVFAHWYSGTVRIPQGKQLEYVHMGYGSKYEKDLFITFEKGLVISTRIKVNGITNNLNAPEGYGIGGMTVFPRSKPKE